MTTQPDDTTARREHIRQLLADTASFSAEVPGFQIVWDASALSEFMRCPRKYYYSMIEGYAPGTTIDLDFGTAYHKALESFAHARHSGQDFDEAVATAVRTALAHTGSYDAAGTWIPWDHSTANKNPRTLVRTVVWYLDQWRNDPTELVTKADGSPFVEVPFMLDFGMVTPLTRQPISICGTLDRRVRFLGTLFELDHKTTGTTVNARYFERYSPNNQVSLYSLAGKILGGEASRGMIIDAAQVAVGFSEFMRMEILRTESMLNEWYESTRYWIEFAERCAVEAYWPMNPESCWSCGFKSICSKDPSVRYAYLQGLPRRRWDPAARVKKPDQQT